MKNCLIALSLFLTGCSLPIYLQNYETKIGDISISRLQILDQGAYIYAGPITHIAGSGNTFIEITFELQNNSGNPINIDGENTGLVTNHDTYLPRFYSGQSIALWGDKEILEIKPGEFERFYFVYPVDKDDLITELSIPNLGNIKFPKLNKPE